LKKILLVGCLFIVFNCDNFKQKINTDKVKENSLYINLEGNGVSFDHFKGKKLFVNYWATWCLPCLKELPALRRLQDKLKDENFVFLFPSTDDLNKIEQFDKKYNYPFKFLQYKGSLDKLEIYALPTTFVYDSSGNIVKRINGVTDWDSEVILNELKAIR
jgi:thiol-disulfide isomerase/thioredoxin